MKALRDNMWAFYGIGGSLIVGLYTLKTDSTLKTFVYEHPDITSGAMVGYFALPIVPVLVRTARTIVSWVSRALRRIEPSEGALLLPLGGTRGDNPVLNSLMDVAYRRLHHMCSNSEQAERAKFRVTLFVPDYTRQDLFQVARFRWDGDAVISATRVRFGTGDVGQAWTSKRAQQIAGITTLGFEEALRRSGLTDEEIKAHILRDRLYFASAPVPSNGDGTRLCGVFSVDAATGNCLRPDWAAVLAKEIFPAIADAIADSERSKGAPVPARSQTN